MLEQVCICMSSAYVRRLDHAYVDPYLKNLINTKTELKLNKIEKYKSSKPNMLKNMKKKPKTNLDKHI